MAEAFTLYKLIILYMLDKVDFPLTNSQISEFVLDKGYTDYFKLQQALSELADGGLILKESTHNRTLFHLTEDGKGTIHLFRDKISKPIQDDIDHFLQTKQYDLKNEVSVKADYMKNAGEEYSVRCQVFENHEPLIDNAYEACTEEKNQVLIEIDSQNDKLIFTIKNQVENIGLGEISHFFEKGFSTKEDGKKHGLGLYNAKMLVNRYHGEITVEIEERKYISFVVAI